MGTPVTLVSSTGAEYNATTPLPTTSGAGSAVDGADATFGAKADAANQDPTATDTFMAFFKGLLGLVGIKTETAPASDTASSGVNGRLQRVAQRLTSLIAQVPAALGQTTKSGSMSVALASDDTALVALTTGIGKSASATFTPAASSHTSGDVNGAAGTFALGAPSGCLFCITDISLLINSATAETPVWALHLYNVTPPSALADDAAFDVPSGDQPSYLDGITIGIAVDLGAATQWIKISGVDRLVKLSGTSLFGYLVNVGTSTPAAVAHTVTISGYPV